MESQRKTILEKIHSKLIFSSLEIKFLSETWQLYLCHSRHLQVYFRSLFPLELYPIKQGWTSTAQKVLLKLLVSFSQLNCRSSFLSCWTNLVQCSATKRTVFKGQYDRGLRRLCLCKCKCKCIKNISFLSIFGKISSKLPYVWQNLLLYFFFGFNLFFLTKPYCAYFYRNTATFPTIRGCLKIDKVESWSVIDWRLSGNKSFGFGWLQNDRCGEIWRRMVVGLCLRNRRCHRHCFKSPPSLFHHKGEKWLAFAFESISTLLNFRTPS